MVKQYIEEMYRICDEIEKSGVVKDECKPSLRENLRQEFLTYIIWLNEAEPPGIIKRQVFCAIRWEFR